LKAEPILLELEAVKERLAAEAGGDSRRFLDQMEAWMVEHPHAGPVVNSPEELQARLRAREVTEPPPPQDKPYRVHNPIIAGLHRTREKLQREQQAETLILKDKPPRKKR
jgi:hypothetical protein